jgi:mono/diheme cytochrome c family protein
LVFCVLSKSDRIPAIDLPVANAMNEKQHETDHAEFLGSPAVNDPSGVNLVRAVLEGVKIGSSRGDNLMPSFAAAYSDAEIAAVSNYVIAHFSGKRGSVTSAAVRAARN